jgi:hypothetical protein
MYGIIGYVVNRLESSEYTGINITERNEIHDRIMTEIFIKYAIRKCYVCMGKLYSLRYVTVKIKTYSVI